MPSHPNKIKGYDNGVPDVAYWIEQIRWGLEWRRERAFESKWATWQKYYRGEWKSNILAHNMFFRFVRTTVPKIYFRNPSVSVISARGGVENYVLSQIMEATDNRLVRQMGLKQEMKKLVQGTWLRGTGVGKLGFGSQYGVSSSETGETSQPLVNRGKEFIEYDRKVIPNMPWWRNVHLSNYVVPYGTIDRNLARWDCFIISREVDDVMKDPRFKTPNDLKGNRGIDELNFNLKRNTTEAKFGVDTHIDLFEIRDRKTGKIFVITPSHDKALVFEDDAWAAIGVDIASTVVFNPDDEGFYGIPDSQILEPLQLEMNENLTVQMYHRRLSIMKLLVQRGSIQPAELEKLINGEILPAVYVDGDINESIKYIQGSTIPPELPQMANALEGIIRDMMGQSRNQSGEFREGSRSPTAREVQEVSEASNIRTDERRDEMADLLTKVITDVNPLIFRNWGDEVVEKVIGPAGIPIWIAFRPKMLEKGTYEFKVDPDTSIPDTKDLRHIKAIEMYGILKENPLIDPISLTRYLLHELHGVAFDDMMRGLPRGQGLSQQRPLQINEFQKLMQNVSQQNPELLAAPGDQQLAAA